MEVSGELRVRDASLRSILIYVLENADRFVAEITTNPPPRVAEADLPSKRLREVPAYQLMEICYTDSMLERLQASSREDD